jgi:hypothetical protein
VAARRADVPSERPRPRPGPGLTAPNRDATQPRTRPAKKPGRQVVLPDQGQTGQIVAAAGNAIVTAARVGRLLGRSGWRIARGLPGLNVVEQQAQRLRQTAAAEMYRLLDLPQSPSNATSPEEQRVAMLVQNAGTDREPLRTAMTELLDRSAQSDSAKNRDYLFGTIVSQLVPDEARILAALASGRTFAAVDVVAKLVGRSSTRTVLSNASTVGAAAGISLPQNVATYLTRLHGFGLLSFGRPGDDLEAQFELLANDPAVRAARDGVDKTKQGNAKIVRKMVSLSPLGREFWAACAPSRPALSRRTS